MLDYIWNPWHGCKKYSEGCKHCYMYYLDAQRDKDGSEIYKVKTNYKLPLKKNRQGEYKIPSGVLVHLCLTSDFFLEEADEWRDEIWEIIKLRKDVTFQILTKRASRIKSCLPDDWNEGYDNVQLGVTAENQTRADERIPVLLDIPAKYKFVMCAPMISEITLDKYLSSGQIKLVLLDGENYDGNRPLYYDWVKKVYGECSQHCVDFSFVGTGNIFIRDGKEYKIPKAYQNVMAVKSGLQIPRVNKKVRVQTKCKTCNNNVRCNGCKWCGKCR